MIKLGNGLVEGSGGRTARPSNPPGSEAARRVALMQMREPIGVWPLLVWAYAREMARFTCGSDYRPAGVSQSTMAWVQQAGRSGVVGGHDAGASFTACCHDDALLVHGAVLQVIDAVEAGIEDSAARREAFALLILYAEKEKRPAWEIPAPVWRVVPRRRKNGKVQHIFGAAGRFQGHAIACEVECVGQIEALGLCVRSGEDYARLGAEAQARYGRWCALLEAIIHRLMPRHGELKRFRLNGIGVPRAPWMTAPQRAT